SDLKVDDAPREGPRTGPEADRVGQYHLQQALASHALADLPLLDHDDLVPADQADREQGGALENARLTDLQSGPRTQGAGDHDEGAQAEADQKAPTQPGQQGVVGAAGHEADKREQGADEGVDEQLEPRRVEAGGSAPVRSVRHGAHRIPLGRTAALSQSAAAAAPSMPISRTAAQRAGAPRR